MAKQIANVDILTDTFNGLILRTNEVIESVKTEVLTANSTVGVTGSPASPRNARLHGNFQANTLVANSITVDVLSANSSAVRIATAASLVANGSSGSAGQILTTDGARVYWSTAGGTGTVTQLANGAGIIFADLPGGIAFGSPITSFGTIRIRAGDGIVVDSRGVSINTAFVQAFATNATTLQNRQWESPGAIGSSTPNTGVFSTVTAGLTTGYRLASDPVFVINNTLLRTQGYADVTTPTGAGTTGGLRIRGNASSVAYLQITNSLATEWANFMFNSTGKATYSGAFEVQNFTFNGTAVYGSGTFAGTEVGYKTIPQIVTNSTATINTTTSSGAHHYKTTTSAISLTVPDNTSSPCPVGTAITIINDAASGDITLVQGTGVTLQLGGTLTTGNRIIGPGGFVTALKVTTNKWIVSGTGVS